MLKLFLLGMIAKKTFRSACPHIFFSGDLAMKTLLSRLTRYWDSFLDLFSTPAQRSCPHCGGGKCFGACQLSREREKAQDAQDG